MFLGLIYAAGKAFTCLRGFLENKRSALINDFLRLWKREVLVLGDSHVKGFSYLDSHLPRGYFLNLLSVSGATASGLSNPRSKTRASTRFRRELKRSRAVLIVIQLGEVDTGFVVWWRAKKYNNSVEVMLESTVKNYLSLLEEAKLVSGVVICVSAPLPTIKDGAPNGTVAQHRCEIDASQKERTELTVKFNAMVEDGAIKLGVEYLNLDIDSMGEDRLVANWLLNRDAGDHHYCPLSYSKLLKRRLNPLILKALVGSK